MHADILSARRPGDAEPLPAPCVPGTGQSIDSELVHASSPTKWKGPRPAATKTRKSCESSYAIEACVEPGVVLIETQRMRPDTSAMA